MSSKPVIFDNPRTVTFKVQPESRTIRGLAVPFGDIADNGWALWRFAKGVLTWGKVKVLDGHDWSRALGTAELVETDGGIEMVAKIARGPRGDEALNLALDGVFDGLSIGLGPDVQFDTVSGVNEVTAGVVLEVSLTPLPAFERAAVTSVAASAAPINNRKEPTMGDEETPKVEAPAGLDFSALKASIDALTAQFAGVSAIPAREPNPQQLSRTVVREALPYRFDGTMDTGFDFSTDLIAGMFNGSGEARVRLEKFLQAVNFAAVVPADVNEINPSPTRTDLYVDQIQPGTPVMDALTVLPLADSTPFLVPKFSSAANYVADHTVDTEPAATATFVTTGQTITPTAVSGYGEISREVVDAGGNPNVSTLLWTQFQREFIKALEVKAAAFLNGLTLTELGTVLDASDEVTTPGTIADLMEANLGELLWIDGGENYSRVLIPQDIWKPLAAAKDGDDRPRYPIKNPTNANGQLGDRYRSMEIGGFNLLPAKSLGTTADKGYAFDPSFGAFWHSAANRITLPETVAKGFRVGIFGYVASAMLDTNKIRKITLQA